MDEPTLTVIFFLTESGRERRPIPWGLEFKAQAHRAEEASEATAKRYLVGLRGTRSLSERWDAFLGLSAEQDEFAGIDLRGIAEVGAVYRALLGPRHLLNLDFGLTWTDEDRLPPELDDSHLGGLLAASYEWAISDNATFSQDLPSEHFSTTAMRSSRRYRRRPTPWPKDRVTRTAADARFPARLPFLPPGRPAPGDP